MIGSLLPSGVSCATLDSDPADSVLFPSEEALIANSVMSRRREFAAGRHCARLALADIGIAPVPILSGQHGEPCWPTGIVGSLTHCTGFRAAAVARCDDIRSIGIDAEPHAPLPEGVLEAIALPEERAHLAGLKQSAPGINWDRMLFSAKESVYKAWFPLALRRLDFSEARINFALEGRFLARLLIVGPETDGHTLTGFSGRWATRKGLVLTAVHVPRNDSTHSSAERITDRTRELDDTHA